MARFEVDEDIRKARTLPSEFYTDERFFELSKERIFARSWHLLGRVSELDQLTPINLLPDVLDEPLLLTRSGSEVRCISNVCTHRGKVLIEQPCSGDLIRCGYHGRRFDLSGKFLSMPEFEGVEDFPSASDDLAKVPTAAKGGFVFASLAPAAGLDEFAAGAEREFAALPEKFTAAPVREYEVDAHWALYCENYLEGFHIPFVHKGLNAVVDYGSYATETLRFSSVQTALDGQGRRAAKYLFVFPNLMFNFYPWGVSVNIVRPISASRTQVAFLSYIADETLFGKGAGGDLHTVELEDEAVVESVQRGIRSRYYSRGRYSPTREQGTHHFHRLIAEFIGDH